MNWWRWASTAAKAAQAGVQAARDLGSQRVLKQIYARDASPERHRLADAERARLLSADLEAAWKDGKLSALDVRRLRGTRLNGHPIVPGLELRLKQRVRVEVEGFSGYGQIEHISTDQDRGLGSRTYPAYFVEFDDGMYGWFNGASIEPAF